MSMLFRKGLMNKFTGPSKIQTYEPKPKTTHYHQQSSSSYTSTGGQGQSSTTKSETSKFYSITYSALPKVTQEPPVNSAAYFEMLQKGNNDRASSNVQQPAAPPHMQGPAPGFGALRDRFKTGSFSENADASHDVRRTQPNNAGSSSLSSLRDQFVNRAKDTNQMQEESFSQRIQHVSRSIIGEDPVQLVSPAPPPQTYQQEESHVQSQSVDEQGVSSEGALADGSSLSGASSLENDTTLNVTPAELEPGTS
jgi:hypothetical protein